ncbi:hypothetical protein LOK49_LG03G02880 [Camellia lanceoleosa]|uniref:Uncharacterized protein n=1 Tax=Camellia lanceoleosa TaxID=1840588 RepID=A0ACC0ID71_9ERIC|nr:hypothetical protein LOK49_LG03G02880 [Camellia lanceoleosa]
MNGSIDEHFEITASIMEFLKKQGKLIRFISHLSSFHVNIRNGMKIKWNSLCCLASIARHAILEEETSGIETEFQLIIVTGSVDTSSTSVLHSASFHHSDFTSIVVGKPLKYCTDSSSRSSRYTAQIADRLRPKLQIVDVAAHTHHLLYLFHLRLRLRISRRVP